MKSTTALNLAQGKFKVEWAVGDLVAGFNQEAEFRFVDGASKPLTSPMFLMDVRPAVS